MRVSPDPFQRSGLVKGRARETMVVVDNCPDSRGQSPSERALAYDNPDVAKV